MRIAISLLAWLGLTTACGGQAAGDEPVAEEAIVGAAGAAGFGGSSNANGAPDNPPSVVPDGDVAGSVGGAVRETSQSGATTACSRTTWTATATVLCATQAVPCRGWPTNPQMPAQAIDGDMETRYTTGRYQTGLEELVVTFPATVSISGIELISVGHAGFGEGPAAYSLELSTDGVAFESFTPPLTGLGSTELLIPFPPTTLKAIKVRQTGRKERWWSILELAVKDCDSSEP